MHYPFTHTLQHEVGIGDDTGVGHQRYSSNCIRNLVLQISRMTLLAVQSVQKNSNFRFVCSVSISKKSIQDRGTMQVTQPAGHQTTLCLGKLISMCILEASSHAMVGARVVSREEYVCHSDFGALLALNTNLAAK